MELKVWAKAMIKKVIKILSNPQGALVQVVLGMCEALIKEFIKDNVEEKLEKAVKYVEEPNELDLGLNALKDMVTSQQREIDEIRNLIKRGK
jgi:NDP-sugar pyrophosphorylase family protein